MRDPRLSALVDTDRRYFESGAVNERIEAATVSWVPGSTDLAAGCVVHCVDPDLDGRDPTEWLRTVRGVVADLGATTCRVYRADRDHQLDRAFRSAGFTARPETAWAAAISPDGARPRRSDVEVHAVDPADDRCWEVVAAVHRDGGIGSGVHEAPPDRWTELMRRRSEGSMTTHLITVDGQPCGTVGTLRAAALVRSKNLVVARQFRRGSIGRSVLALLATSAEAAGCSSIGAFAVPRTDGDRLYPAAGMTDVGEQIEWSSPLAPAGRA